MGKKAVEQAKEKKSGKKLESGKKLDKSHKKNKKLSLSDFDKYYYYRNSVQSPDNDVMFFRDTFKKLRGRKPRTMREDFCGTFAISCEWVKLNPQFEAIGVDLDPEPIAYGKKNYLPLLKPEQQKRVKVYEKDVLSKGMPSADIVIATNFSYFIFKQRQQLVKYFSNVHRSLNENGLFIIDVFGGPHCMEPNEEETEHEKWSYFWDQDLYDPVNNHAMFYIHFKRKGEKKREKVFTYDWRMWSIPELRDILQDAGFNHVHVYWEGSDKDGEGNGIFEKVNEGEECDAWVAYLVAEK